MSCNTPAQLLFKLQLGWKLRKLQMELTAGEKAERGLLMRANHVFLREPGTHFVASKRRAFNVPHHARDYFGPAMVKASTICVMRYWYAASVPSMSASVFCKAAWLNSTMELSPRL